MTDLSSITLYAIATVSISLFLLAGIRLATLSLFDTETAEAAEITPSRYRPMERLLREEDLQYLSSQGIDKRGLARIRAERRATFRKYLHSLRCDFAQVLGLVRVAILKSREARPDLLTALLRARVFFAYTVLVMEMRLMLHATGLSRITIDVQPTIEALTSMSEQWRIMNPAVAMASAG